MDKLLEPSELLEVFARHDADPVGNNPKALSDFYDVDEELLTYVLKYCRPPVVIENDGIMWGVYDVKQFE